MLRASREEASSGHLPYRGDVGGAALVVGPCCPIAAPFTTSSTRRFFWRPSAVSLGATGRVFPNPCAVTDEPATPCAIRKSLTESARRSDSCWLNWSLPTLSV